MSVAYARFYKMRGSLSSGEYPLLNPSQDLTGYLVHSVQVKYAKGLQTTIVLPAFTGYEEVNIAELDGEYYWVTAWKEATTLNGTVAMTLDYMGPTSLLRRGSSLRGVFAKTATNECPYLAQSITNGLRLIDSSQAPADLEMGIVYKQTGTYGYEEVGYWVQVTGFAKDPITDEPYITRVGFPIGVRTDIATPSSNKMIGPAPGGNQEYFPRYGDLIKDITAVTGIEASQVIDCSISKRCPYNFRKTEVSVSASITQWKVDVLDTEGQPITTQLMSDNVTCVYVLGTRFASAQYSHASQTVTLALDTDYKRQCACIQIRDWNENAVMEIPVDGSSMDITFSMRDDESGIYTVITHKDQEITLTEGKLPYVDNTWETYKAYQMDTDRMSMENAIRFAEYQRETQRVVGTINSAISGATSGLMAGFISGSGAGAAALAVGGALGGMLTGLYGQDRAMELTRLQAKADYELSKRQAIDQPNTGYNVAYGMIYVYLNQRNTLRACVVLPYDVDSAYYEGFVGEFGYPAEGVRTVEIANGYYQGKPLSTSPAESGMYWDRLGETFEKGFKFVTLGLPSILNARLSGSGMDVTFGGVAWKTRARLYVNGEGYGANAEAGWEDTFVEFFNRSDKEKFVGWHWGQRTGDATPDSFGYVRYAYIDGILTASNDFTSITTYTQIENESTVSAILERYQPRLIPRDSELSTYMETNAFNTLTIDNA